MRLNFKFIYTLLVIPAALGFIGESCKTDNGVFGVCMSEMDCTPVTCDNKKKCINDNYSVTPYGKCPDGDSVCCVKIVKEFHEETLSIPGRCLNKMDCDSVYNMKFKTKECPGKNAVLCISNDIIKYVDKKNLILVKKPPKKGLIGTIFYRLKLMGIYI